MKLADEAGNSKRLTGNEPPLRVLHDCKLYKEASLASNALGLIGKDTYVSVLVLPRTNGARVVHWVGVFSEALQ